MCFPLSSLSTRPSWWRGPKTWQQLPAATSYQYHQPYVGGHLENQQEQTHVLFIFFQVNFFKLLCHLYNQYVGSTGGVSPAFMNSFVRRRGGGGGVIDVRCCMQTKMMLQRWCSSGEGVGGGGGKKNSTPHMRMCVTVRPSSWNSWVPRRWNHGPKTPNLL